MTEVVYSKTVQNWADQPFINDPMNSPCSLRAIPDNAVAVPYFGSRPSPAAFLSLKFGEESSQYAHRPSLTHQLGSHKTYERMDA